DAGGIVAGWRHPPVAVTAERRSQHGVCMAFQDGDLLAALCIPDARGVVTGCRHNPLAIVAEHRGLNAAGMAFKDADLLAAFGIPDACCVQSPRHYPFVVA